MRSRVCHAGLIVAVALAACSSGSSAPAGKVEVQLCSGQDCDISSIVNDGSTVTVTVLVTNAAGTAATGSVHVSALVGTIDGKTADDVVLDATGAATATYACDASIIPTCSESATLIIATWNGITGSGRLVLLSPAPVDAGTDGGSGGGSGGGAGGGSAGGGSAGGGSAGGGSAGGSGGGSASDDAGTVAPITETLQFVYVSPVSIGTSTAASNGLPTTATVVFEVLGNGTPLAGGTVNFGEAVGESLLTLSATSGVSDLNGIVSVKATATGTDGIAHVIATIPDSASTATAQVGIFGPPAAVIETAISPGPMGLLGIHGSGIQEEGLMTFQVVDAYGTPVPGEKVDFSEANPQLVNLDATSGETDVNGNVLLAYTANAEVGVTTLIATADNTSVQGTHQVAVRGAKPSASGFYFKCDNGALRVYDTITELSTMTCHVRLTDRFGNRVGIATPVNFATEAGAITASAVTTPFNVDEVDNSAEGTVDVTFTTDMGNGSAPADVIPLEPEDAGVYPSSRIQPEPRQTLGQITYNPRDHLVTIIAWTQGEEAFVDANHNGVYDPGELFVDEGDPFLDENDDNSYDQVVPGGQWEPRFCGDTSDCSTYHGPNGVWDSQATIWTPTWVVFDAIPSPRDVPAGAPEVAGSTFTPSTCADYADSNAAGHDAIISADVYFYDDWFNPPVVGSTYKQVNLISPLATSIGADVTLEGFAPELDEYGAFGQLATDSGFWYGPVSGGGGACSTENGTQCLYNIHFQSFDDGDRGTVFFANPNLGSGVYGCAPVAGSGGPSADGPLAPIPFDVIMGVTNPTGTETSTGEVSATFAPTLPPAATDGGS